MPTLAGLVGAETPENVDGISFLPTLLEKGDQQVHDFMYWEFHELGGRQAVRKDNWKLVRNQVLNADKTSTELYDLNADLGEQNNLADQHPEVVKDLLDLMDGARTPSEVFTFQSPTIIK